MDEIDAMAAWTPWMPLANAISDTRAQQPGAYMVRLEDERRTRLGAPVRYYVRAAKTSVAGRLLRYDGGVVTGLIRHALDAAIADPDWLEVRLKEARAGRPQRIEQWGQMALIRAKPEVRFATCGSAQEALHLEDRVKTALEAAGQLWNPQRTTRARL
jgi:hypothetical protein